jgi:hypothetical protein
MDNLTAEKYDFNKGSWKELPCLNEVHENSRCIVVGDYLYTFFGRKDKTNFNHNIERLNLTSQDKWEVIQVNLKLEIQQFSMINIGDEIIICGGKHLSLVDVKECYKYNIKTNNLEIYQHNLPYYTTFKHSKFMLFRNHLINITEKRGFIIFNPNDGKFSKGRKEESKEKKK